MFRPSVETQLSTAPPGTMVSTGSELLDRQWFAIMIVLLSSLPYLLLGSGKLHRETINIAGASGPLVIVIVAHRIPIVIYFGRQSPSEIEPGPCTRT